MQWQKTRLGEIAEIKSGKRLPAGHDFSPTVTPYAYIRARDIKNGKITTDNLSFIGEATREKIKRYIIRKGDVAITIVANIGDVGYCQENADNANLTENAVRLTDFKPSADSRYVAYYLADPSMKRYMEGLATGAAQAKLGIYKIQKIPIILPPLDIQQAIALQLSRYDALIENNLRRIDILTTKTEQLYKEWFVRKRFPGHSDAKSAALPSGWIVERLGNILDVKYGKDHKMLPDGDIPVFGSGGIMRHGNRALYNGEAVLIPRKGSLNNIMYFSGAFWTVDTMFYGVPKLPFIAKYLYLTLSKIDMASFNTGAALPSMTTDILNHFKVMLPASDILKLFDKNVTKLFALKVNLQRQNALLARERDLLLPRLMSGRMKP